MSAFLSLIPLAIITEQWARSCFAPADVAQDSLARLLTLENTGFTTAEKKLDKLLGVKVAWVMTFTKTVSCVHLSLVNDLIVRMPATSAVVLTYLILIFGSRLMRWYDLSKSTRCVREKWRIVLLLPLFICFIKASSPSKMCRCRTHAVSSRVWSTWSMSPNGSWCFTDQSLMNRVGVTSSLWMQNIYDWFHKFIARVTLHQAI